MRPDAILLFIGNIGLPEILLIILIVILLFGAQKIPELARALGRAQKEFQRARDEVEEEAKPPPVTEEERLRRAAKDLGISTEGKTIEEIKAAIAGKVQGPA